MYVQMSLVSSVVIKVVKSSTETVSQRDECEETAMFDTMVDFTRCRLRCERSEKLLSRAFLTQ
jgi:hypothetical protein